MFNVTNFPAVHLSFQLVKIKASYIRKPRKNEFGKYMFSIPVGVRLLVLTNVMDGTRK
jgi:hypothetical protein